MMHPDVLSTRHRHRTEMLAIDDANSRVASRRPPASHHRTPQNRHGFRRFRAARMQRHNVSDTASFSYRESHEAVANVEDSDCQSVGKIGDKQTSE
jgi:hypothetical protein